VKNQIFLWIKGQFHFGNSRGFQKEGAKGICHHHTVVLRMQRIKSGTKNPGPFAAPEIFVEAQTLLHGLY